MDGMWRCLFVALVTAGLAGALEPPRGALRAECVALRDAEKFDCFPEPGPSQEGCETRGCCWVATRARLSPLGVPACFYPPNYGGYEYVNVTAVPGGVEAFLRRSFSSAYPRDVPLLRLQVEEQTDTRLHIKISDAENQRYETPYPKLPPATRSAKNPAYSVDIDAGQDGFQVQRAGSGEVLFSTRNIGGFIFSDQFLQISSTISGKIYGLGEHRTNLSLSTQWTRYTMLNRDIPPNENTNLYGSHPFYIVVERNGLSHGVYLHSSNIMDVILQPLDAVTFRPIGGILDFYFFMGPTPADVVRQYTELVGRPAMPPYWALGFHLCKLGFNTDDVIREFWQRNRDAGVYFDTQWIDYDYMANRNMFTVDQERFGGLGDFVEELHSLGMHFVPIIDPGISGSEPPGTYPAWDSALERDVLVKDQNGSVFLGRVWNPVSTAWIDFTHPQAVDYWADQVRSLHQQFAFDGMWIDMNEPSNFMEMDCPQDELETPQYPTGVTGDKLSSVTICMTAKQAAGVHYNVHNLYGISEADVTNRVLRDMGKRPFVISRSTFAGSGRYTGHWSGDDESSWYDMVKSVPETLTFNLYGVPLVGADICGFRSDTTEALCNRWTQLGAFYPFSRNHNGGSKEQDPAIFGGVVLESAKKAFRVRYTLLPYLYTLFYHAHVHGDTVARPLFFEFAADPDTHEVDRAFMWGPALYIVPVLEEGSTTVTAYLPAGQWYDWYTDAALGPERGEVTLDAPLDTIPLLLRGGHIVPTQAPEVTTTASRKNPFTLIAASDGAGSASGSLFWDDGEAIDSVESNEYGLLSLEMSGGRLTSTVVQWTTEDTPVLGEVRVLGVGFVNSVRVDGQPATFANSNNTLAVLQLNIPLSRAFEITWN